MHCKQMVLLLAPARVSSCGWLWYKRFSPRADAAVFVAGERKDDAAALLAVGTTVSEGGEMPAAVACSANRAATSALSMTESRGRCTHRETHALLA